MMLKLPVKESGKCFHLKHPSACPNKRICNSLQDLIMSLRKIGALRVLRVNAKQLQVYPPIVEHLFS
jgi:hypothetical protein